MPQRAHDGFGDLVVERSDGVRGIDGDGQRHQVGHHATASFQRRRRAPRYRQRQRNILASGCFRDEGGQRCDDSGYLDLAKSVLRQQLVANQIAHLGVARRDHTFHARKVGRRHGLGQDLLPVLEIRIAARGLLILLVGVANHGELREIDIGLRCDRSRVHICDMPQQIVGGVPIQENVMGTHVEVRQIVGNPQ